MIDRFLCAKARDTFSESYEPKDAIISSRLINAKASNLVVAFPPWGGGGYLMHNLVNRLARQNAVLEYSFHHQVLEPNIERVVQSFNTIRETITQKLQNLEYESITFVGLSLGNVALALVAEEFPNFTKATMVTPGSSLSTAVWEGLRGKGIKNSFSSQGIAKDELDEAWHILAPKNHVSAFRDKEVNTIVSNADRIIPTYTQVEMVDKLRATGSDLSRIDSSLGHVATLTRFCVARGKI